MAKRGEPNLRASARALTAEALKALAEIARDGASEHARIAAAVAILDRAHGKPGQAVKVGGDEDGRPILHLVRWATDMTEATPDPCQKEEPPTS